MRTSFAISVAANLLLLTTIVAARVDTTRSVDAPLTGSGQLSSLTAERVRNRNPETVEEFVSMLESTALTRDQKLNLARSWLEAKHRDAGIANAPEYWQQGFAPPLAELASRISAEDSTRADLIALFGAAAATEPAFDSLFRPLGVAYDFLSSKAQLALQRQQHERVASAQVARRDSKLQSPSCLMPAFATESRPASSLTLPAAFTPLEAVEYRLRFSPRAEQLRESGVADSEREFRELMGELQTLDSDATPEGQADVRSILRSRMGDAAFARFWSLQDPLFPPIEAYLVREGFSVAAVQAAYTIALRSQETLLGSIGSQRDRESTLATVSRIRQDEIAALSRLLGPDAARGVLAARTQAEMALATRATTSC
jgi:hypothetical protein